jgi:tetratricopeptide (TPR) repeat protein
MRSISKALARLHEDGAWFARAHELRVLAIQVSADLRKPALQQLLALEFHADNFSPWVGLEDAHTVADDGWQARANRLAEDWQRRREAFAKEGVELPALAPAPAPAPGNAVGDKHRPSKQDSVAGLAPFSLTLAEELGALRAPLQGLVVVLAPAVVEDPGAFEQDLTALLRSPALARCRLVLLLADDLPLPRELLEELGEAALLSDCRVDPAAFEADVEALLASGEGGALAGTARPRGVVPPRRVDDPPELPKEQRDAALRQAGIDPQYMEAAPKLGGLVIGAALAMKQGKGPEAVRLQREARDLSGQLGMPQVKVICQIALASYLSGLGHPQEAVRELEEAAQTARTHGLGVQESQAWLSLGLVHALGKRLPQAAQAYVQSARVSEKSGSPLIAIESWRLAGQLAAQQNLFSQASSAFQEAIRIASGADAQVAKLSSAPEAARTLAVLCRKRGLTAQADALEEQARVMEQGEPIPAVPVDPASPSFPVGARP